MIQFRRLFQAIIYSTLSPWCSLLLEAGGDFFREEFEQKFGHDYWAFLSVIPAKAGIQFFCFSMDSGFRRSDVRRIISLPQLATRFSQVTHTANVSGAFSAAAWRCMRAGISSEKSSRSNSGIILPY
jgi:hypothetical protein